MSKIIHDTIDLTFSMEHTVVNDTVKIVAQIVAIVAPGQTDGELRGDIRATMKRFIESADWQFSNMRRTSDAGMERVTLTASARVPESENYNLSGRAKLASRPGLEIEEVHADTAIPQVMIEEAEKTLRMKLLEKIKIEQKEINLVMGSEPYRVHQVNFSSTPANPFANHIVKSPMRAASAATYGSGFGGDEDEVLGNAQKLSMMASVVLARNAY
jgi:hypothetical protein